MIPFSFFTFLDKICYMFFSVRCLEKGKRINIFLNVFSVSSCWLLVAMFLDNCYLFLLCLFVCRSVGIASVTLCTTLYILILAFALSQVSAVISLAKIGLGSCLQRLIHFNFFFCMGRYVTKSLSSYSSTDVDFFFLVPLLSFLFFLEFCSLKKTPVACLAGMASS